MNKLNVKYWLAAVADTDESPGVRKMALDTLNYIIALESVERAASSYSHQAPKAEIPSMVSRYEELLVAGIKLQELKDQGE